MIELVYEIIGVLTISLIGTKIAMMGLNDSHDGN